MGPVDTIWLNMDTPENLMVIDSLMVLDGPADWDRVTELFRTRLVEAYPSFRQRVKRPRAGIGSPRWTHDPNFLLRKHLIHHTLPDGEDATLQRYIEEQMRLPLKQTRPLWQAHLIDGHQKGSVIYSRIHHCIADGIALNEVMLSLTEAAPDGDLPGRPAGTDDTIGSRPSLVAQVQDAADHGLDVLTSAARAVASVPSKFGPTAAIRAVDQLTGALRQVARTGDVADKLLLAEAAPEGPLTGAPGPAKRAVWCEPFALADIKLLGRKTGTTVNDVLMSAMAGALGGYLEEHGARRGDLPTMVPVNVRTEGHPPPELGNEFALIVVEYPTGLREPIERLMETHRRMDAIKNSPEAFIVFSGIRVIGMTIKELEKVLVGFFSSKATGVTTNVPGPRETRYLGGSRIDGMLAWAPTAGDQTIAACIYSYDGQVWVGFKADAQQVAQPEKLVAAFDAEVKELVRLAHAI